MKPKSTLRNFLALAGSSLLAISSSHANQTWDGSDVDDDFWSSADNWGLNTVPTWASAINFGGNTRNSAINDLLADTIIGGINFTNDGSVGNSNAFTLSGNRIILGGNITTTANTAGSTITNVIDLDMILDATRTITTNQQSATVQHNLTISGDISSSGAFGIIKAGSGILSLGGANTYTGTTAVSAGTLQLTNTSAIASSPLVTLATGTTLDLRKDTTGGTFTNTRLNPVGTVTINADRINSGSGQTLTLGGTVVYAGGSTSTINFTGGNSYNVGINGMYFNAGSSGQSFTLNPTTANAIIGAIRVNTSASNLDGWGAGTANNVNLFLSGSAGTNNTIASITEISGAATQFVFNKNTAANWTVGNISAGTGNSHTMSAGNLTLNGTFTFAGGTDRKFTLSGGILNYNNAAAIATNAGTTSGNGFVITGGSLDNTSGAAITTSTTNPRMTWGGNWTFIGSNGADSDLNLGNGAVFLTDTRQVSVTNAATTLSVGGSVSGVGGLTKAGAGTLNLSGTNTNTGTTMVSGGTLLLSNASALQTSALDTTGAGAVTLSGHTAPTFGGLRGATGNLASIISNYSTVTGLTLNPQTGFSNTYGGVISNGSGATTLTKSGGGTQVLSGPNTYTGVTNIDAGNLTVGSAENADVSGPLGKQLANVAGTIVFGGGTLQYSAANTFDYSGRFSTAAAQAIRVDTNGQTVTWATDLISSTGTLAKTGTGTLNLTGANTFSGATTVSNGTLDLGGGTATGSLASTNLILAGATFSYTRTGGTTQAFTSTNINAGASTVTAVAGNTITLGTLTPAAGGSVNFGTTGTITTSRTNVNGILGGWATFGGDNWAVGNGADNAITGYGGAYTLTSVAGATASNYTSNNISVDQGATLGGVITPNTLRFNTAGAFTLTLATGNNVIPGIMVNSVVGNNASLITGGTLQGASNGSLSVIQNNTSNTLTIGSIIANNGTSGLSKSGAGTVILTQNNTYTGTTSIGAGTLQLGNGGTTGALSTSSSIVNNGNLTINRSDAVTQGTNTFGNNISGSGSVTMSGSNTLALGSGNTYSGGFTLNSGSLVGIASGAYTGFGSGLVTINGGKITVNSGAIVTFANAMNWNATFGFDRGASNTPTVTWAGPITLGANVTVNSASGFGAAGGNYVHIFNGGILDDITGGRALSFTTNGTGGRQFVTLNGNNTFTGNISITQGSLTIGGSSRLGGGDYSGNITVSGTTTAPFTFSSSSDQILRGVISGFGTLGLTKDTSSASKLTLAGNNTYAGPNTVSAGTLQFARTASLYNSATGSWTAANIRVASGATLAFNVGGTGEFTAGNVTTLLNNLAASSSATNGMNAGSNLGFDTSNASGGIFTIANIIADTTGASGGSRGLTKLGTGILILDQTNTYTGATNVNAGKLVVNGNISSSSLTSVASGATIGGSGTVGELTVSSGGFINPGNSPGILNVSGDYTQAGLYTAEITGLTAGTEHDQINVTGSVDITGGSLTALFTAGTYAANDLIFILLNDGVDAITGTYSGFAQGATVIEYDGFDWKISYTANSTTNSFTGGNDIALMAIPEPKAALLGGLGLLLLLRRRR